MVVTEKNPALKKKIFKKMSVYDKKALVCYRKGDMKCGKKNEAISDRLYKNNYSKIFKVTKN